MAHALHDPDCVAGLIIGTGTNICYVEKGENVTKLGMHHAPRGEREAGSES
jgi:hexokinase